MAKDDSYRIAVMHYAYWGELGLSHQEMLDALGYRTSADTLLTREVIDKIELAWRCLRWGRRAA